MSIPMLEREQAWVTRMKEVKEILRDPDLVPSERHRLTRELKTLVKNTSRSFYEGTEAMHPWEYTDLPTGHLEPTSVCLQGSDTTTLEQEMINV